MARYLQGRGNNNNSIRTGYYGDDSGGLQGLVDKTETALAAAGDGEFTFMFTFSAFRSSCDLVVRGAAAAQHQHGHVPPAGEGRHQQVEAASPEATTHHAERPQDGREL